MAGLFNRLFRKKEIPEEPILPPPPPPARVIPRRVPESLACVRLADIRLVPASQTPLCNWLGFKVDTAIISPPLEDEEYETFGNYIAVDVETTGLDPVTGEILEVAALRFEKYQPVELYTALIKSLKFPHVPGVATEVNGITDELLTDAVTITEIVPSLQSFLDQAKVIVGHNLGFDINFLYAGGLTFENNRYYIDTLANAKKYLTASRYERKNGYNLAALCRHYGIDQTDAHCAAADAYAAGELFRALIQDMKENG